MAMQMRRLGPVDERPLPRKGRSESVIPTKNLKKTKEGLRPRVPAFELLAKIPMYWDGLCVEAGHNYVDVARFDQLPKKTRAAVKAQILEGAFKMRGYLDARAALEEANKAKDDRLAEAAAAVPDESQEKAAAQVAEQVAELDAFDVKPEENKPSGSEDTPSDDASDLG